MSPGAAKTTPGGHFGLVGPRAVGQKRSRTLVEEGDLSEQQREALEAEDFIVYGRASVEQYDEDNPPQRLEMGAFEDQLEDFMSDGIISRRHKDIPVGEPMSHYTLEEPTTVQVGGDEYDFEAGDVLETGVDPGCVDDDTSGELWIIANIGKDSELERETRTGALTGDLDGFSVTVFCKEWEETSKGQRVTDLDWHSVTIGSDEQIKNKDSRFGVAEYKALDAFATPPGGPARKAVIETLEELPTDMSTDTDENQGFWEQIRDKAAQKADSGGQTPDSGTDSDAEGDYEDEMDGDYEDGDKEGDYEDGDKEGDYEDEMKAGDPMAVVEKVRDEMGDDEADTLVQAMEGGHDDYEGDYEEMEGHGDDHEGEPPAAGNELKSEIADSLADQVGDELATKEEVESAREKMADLQETVEELKASVEEAKESAEDAKASTEEVPDGELATKEEVESAIEAAGETIDEKMNGIESRLPDGEPATKADLEDVTEAAAEVFEENISGKLGEVQQATAQKAATGSTPDPSAGSAKDSSDYIGEIQERFGSS